MNFSDRQFGVGPQSVANRLLVLDLREEDDHKHDWEGPGGEEPEYRELPPDSRVVLHHGEHVEPLNGDSQDGEESRDDCNHEEPIEEFEMVATLLDDGGVQSYDPVQEQGQWEEGGGDGVGVGEEAVGQRTVNELLDENHEGENAGDEADTAQDDVKRGQF